MTKGAAVYDYQYYPGSNRVRQVTNLYPGVNNFGYTASGSLTNIGNFSMNAYYDGFEQMNRRTRPGDRKSTRLNSSHIQKSRMPSSA